jgi:hypothetical protein
MYWVMVAIVSGIGFGYVQIRRKRKATAKAI